MAKITNERTQAFRKAFEQNSKQIALQRGVVKNGIRASAENIQTHVENTPVFSIDLATGKVANQKQSGRCWMFAALNTFRHKLLTTFQLRTLSFHKTIPSFGINTRRQITSMKIY